MFLYFSFSPSSSSSCFSTEWLSLKWCYVEFLGEFKLVVCSVDLRRHLIAIMRGCVDVNLIGCLKGVDNLINVNTKEIRIISSQEIVQSTIWSQHSLKLQLLQQHKERTTKNSEIDDKNEILLKCLTWNNNNNSNLHLRSSRLESTMTMFYKITTTHYHQAMSLSRISLVLSRHPSLSSIAPDRSSRLYPVSA